MDQDTRLLIRQWREAVRILTGKGSRKRRPAPVTARSGRPRYDLNIALILHYRDGLKLGWSRIATTYHKTTGQYISRETAKRRYNEAKRKG